MQRQEYNQFEMFGYKYLALSLAALLVCFYGSQEQSTFLVEIQDGTLNYYWDENDWYYDWPDDWYDDWYYDDWYYDDWGQDYDWDWDWDNDNDDQLNDWIDDNWWGYSYR